MSALVVVALVAGALAWTLDQGLPGGVPFVSPPCTVETATGELELERDEARRLADVAARSERAGDDLETTARAVAAARQAAATPPPTPDAAQTAASPSPTPDEDDRALARALRGYEGPALTCRTQHEDLPAQEELPSGLTPRAAELSEAVQETFGDLPMGGYAPGGVSTGHIPGSAHYDGRAVDIFFRPVSEENRRRGWVLANWLVAHADRLDVATVIFDDRIWTARRSVQGWRDYTHPGGDTASDVLRHRDHVHVDVRPGDPAESEPAKARAVAGTPVAPSLSSGA